MHSGKSAGARVRVAGSLCAAICLPLALQAQAWVHPGIVASPQQLAATRAAYQAGNPVIVDQVNKAKDSEYGSLSYAGALAGRHQPMRLELESKQRLSGRG